MQPLTIENITVDPVRFPFSSGPPADVSLLRLDKIHPVISGNKWFKLQYYLAEAQQSNKTRVVTFGGAWSNHIIATAAACKLNGLQSIGIIRGEQPPKLSATLKQAMAEGMKLVFTSRATYKNSELPPGSVFTDPDTYVVPEGGYGENGAKGAATITGLYEPQTFTHILCAVGTGTMMAGLINSSLPDQQVTGISVLKNNYSISDSVAALISVTQQVKNWEILHDYPGRGYGKYNVELIAFMNAFYTLNGIATDFVYTGKLLLAVQDLINKAFFIRGSKILVIHSGGLKGNNSLPGHTLIF